jgi:UDP-N-acetylmuramoyl-L-alanyl-D-glutamate--2,6-diaminopimelate ligase
MPRNSSTRRRSDRFDEQPARQAARLPRVIAVTGTSGKTTTAWLTAAVLAEAGLAPGVLSDLGCLGPADDAPISADYSSPIWFTTWLARLAAAGCSHAVVEVNDRMLLDNTLAAVSIDTVVVTNLGGSRRVRGSRRRHDQAVKAGLVGSLGGGGCLVSGCDSAGQALLRGRLPAGVDLITAGLAADCDVRATAVEGSLFGRTVLASCRGQIVPLSLDTPVVPFVRDSLLAAAVGGRYGVSLEAAVRGIESAGAVPGRVERIDRGHEAAIFVDSPTSRHALAATLGSLRRLTSGRLVVLAEEPLVSRLGAGQFGPLVARHCDACVVAPTSVLAEDPAAADVSAYARVDRLLGSLGAGDCGLVLGGGRTTPPGRRGGRFPLGMLVDAWLQLAEPAPTGHRRAA